MTTNGKIEQRWNLRRIAHLKEHIENVRARGGDNGELDLMWNILDKWEKEERNRVRKNDSTTLASHCFICRNTLRITNFLRSCGR